MKFSLALVALFATSAIAIPTASERRATRLERRRAGRQSLPIKRLSTLETAANGIKQVEYSENWCGAVLSKPAGTWKYVTGTFTVPTLTTEGSASAWVGIDGYTCKTAIFQTGVDFTYSGGSVSYDGWYEWYPDYAYEFSGISFSAGDTVKLTVTASSTKTGTAVIENVTKGITVTKSLTSSYALCEQDAEWIVEDYEEGSSLVELTNWGTVTFTDAEATTNSGSTVTASGATIIDIEQNNKVLTSVSVSGSTVTIKHV